MQLALGAPLAPAEGDAAIAESVGRCRRAACASSSRYRADELRRTLEFDARRSALARYAVHDPDGALVLEVRYADYRDVGGRRASPSRIDASSSPRRRAAPRSSSSRSS